jgi:hypothetical protein
MGDSGEEAALRVMAAKALQLRLMVGSMAAVLAVAFGVPAYWVGRALLLDQLGVNVPSVTAALAFLPGVLLVFAARAVARALVRARRPSWIAASARDFGVREDQLDELTLHW